MVLFQQLVKRVALLAFRHLLLQIVGFSRRFYIRNEFGGHRFTSLSVHFDQRGSKTYKKGFKRQVFVYLANVFWGTAIPQNVHEPFLVRCLRIPCHNIFQLFLFRFTSRIEIFRINCVHDSIVGVVSPNGLQLLFTSGSECTIYFGRYFILAEMISNLSTETKIKVGATRHNTTQSQTLATISYV